MMITETDKFLIEIEKLYTLKSILSLRKLPSLRNNVFCVSCNEGDYIFKLAPLDTSKGIENEYRTIDAIHSCGGPVPIPFKSKVEDNPLVSCSGGIYVVRGYRHVAGNNPPVDKKTFFSFGATIGKLHLATATWERPPWLPIATISSLLYSPLDSLRIRYSSQESIFQIECLINKLAPILEAHLDPLMFGWTHGDCHHHNSIITPNNDVVLLDFEDTCWQSRMYDLATAIWGTFGRGGTSGVWDALIHGYNSVCRLNDDEAKLIRYLIVARHLWWLGFRARYWDDWHQPYSLNEFFSNGIDLLMTIAREACDLSV